MPVAGLFPFLFLNTSFLCLNFDTPFIFLPSLPMIFVSNSALPACISRLFTASSGDSQVSK